MRLSTYFLLSAMAFAFVAVAYPAPASAQYPPSHDVHGLFGTHRSCRHVIDLLLRYGSGGRGDYQSSGGLIQPTAYGPAVVPHAEIGDLELLAVTIQSDGDATCGPTFGVTVRNNSQRDVTDFRISIVGVLHRIHPLSPTTVHCVEKVCAGAVVECQISLPVEALSMGRAGEQILCLQTLVVAIDSYDQLLECDESNNLKVIALADVPRAVVVGVEEELSRGNTETAPATVAPSEPGKPALDVAPESNLPSGPVDANPESNLDNLDFNNLDLSEAAAAVSRF